MLGKVRASTARTPLVGVSRSIFALVNDLDRAYSGRGDSPDRIGVIDTLRAVYGRSHAAKPVRLIGELRRDEGIAEADMLLLTAPNQLGVDYNVRLPSSLLEHVAPALGWR
ncbi:hypothetical protein [Massilia timonae]|uniref:Luciferase family protein n=1 Tax=Massilia timonae TaxID=47229 RepID=A0A1S2NF66_9BURK|nr:hypothetical protein [Massilia timonae]OIJ43678.1 luciferase family protein [Massilia timonae]